MSTPGPTTAQRSAELRAAMEERIQRQRQRPLPTWLASRNRRRALALLPAVVFATGVIAATAGGGFSSALLLGATSLLGCAGTLWLRRATQMLDAAPAALLDERELGQRDHAYRRGFHLVLAVLGALGVLAVADAFSAQQGGDRLFDALGWMALTFAAFLAATMLPAAALAWTWRAPADDADDVEG